MRLPVALAALLLSGGLACAADVVFPRGSTVGLVPPEGMVESTHFAGFEDPAKGSSILMVEMPPQAYDQVVAGFTDAALATKGITVESRGTLPLGDAKTLLVAGKQQAGQAVARKWVLLVGTPATTALVTVQEPSNAPALTEEEVRKILQTIAFRPPPKPEELIANLPFKLETLSGFRVAKVVGNTAVILTDGPKDVVEGAEQAMFVAGVAPGAPREDDRRQFALRAFSSLPGVKDVRIQRAEPLRIGGQPGFEILAEGKDLDGKTDVKVVQWLRFGSNAYLRMIGMAKTADFTDAYPKLRAIRDGIVSN